jgi:microsomal dipeptidase-like Zn-dependent dipeptidase
MRRSILVFVVLWLVAATSTHAGGCATAVDLANDVWTAFKTAAYKVGCPDHTDFGHQQVYADWLKQAHQRGLKLMVVSAVNNEPLCRLLKLLYPDRNRQHECDDMYNIKRQIQAFHDFQKAHADWYEIAVHPWHARKIINEQKLAVVISVEASNLFGKFPTSAGDFSSQLDDLYALGVRTLQPVHETDSRFAGAAPHRLQFELFQAVKWPTRVIEDLARGTFGGFAPEATARSQQRYRSKHESVV